MSETRICENCGAVHPIDEMYQVEGAWLCEDCAERLTVICEHCAERVYEENAVEDDTHTLCDHCFDEYYVRCEDCGRIISRDRTYWDNDDNAYCSSCWDNHDEVIHEYIKTDGSLDEGLELVTHPMTLEYHLNEMPWAEVLRKAQRMGYLSHAAGTCGLHVHISRLAFGCTYEQQETAIARLLYFVEKFWAELLRFSRRTQSQINQWAARYGARLTPSEQMSHAKNSCAGRYTAVNLTNSDTVEIRMFRGTLKLNTLKATLQMVNHLVEVAISMSDAAVQDMSWFDFLDDIDEPELIQYLKERRLYVNEPINTLEEE